MDEQLARVIGARLRAARMANHRTQVVVAGLAGITADYLHQIEHGKKLPTLPVLTQLAQVLNVPLSSLVEQPPPGRGDRPCMTDMGVALYRALTQPVTLYEVPSVPELHDRVRSAWRIWQTSPYRYTKLGSQLPALITDTAQGERWYRSEGELPNVGRCSPVQPISTPCCARSPSGSAVEIWPCSWQTGQSEQPKPPMTRTALLLPGGISPTSCSRITRPKVPKTSRCEALQRSLPSYRTPMLRPRHCTAR
jgi:transcriptional regulator with XRE-family HTH domain